MIFVSVSFLSKHNMSILASSSMDTNRKTLPEPDEALRSAHPQCEEEGLKCNPSSSDVVIAAEEIGEGLGGWRACLSTPSDNIAFTTNAQPGSHDMHIESFVGCPTNDNFTFSTANKGP